MSDVPFCSSENACTEGGEQTNGCEPVCINVSRIYDSCGAKDCLSNLPVMFTEANQKIIDGACSVKISNVRIITSTVDVEPVAFHRGFYSVYTEGGDTLYVMDQISDKKTVHTGRYDGRNDSGLAKIGRASCRERV